MLTVWLGWGILAALAAAWVFVPPATWCYPGEYLKEVRGWVIWTLLMLVATAALGGLVALAIMLIRGQL